MTSHELAQHLLAHPDVTLILQKDAEGNGYSPLSGIEMDVVYIPDSTYSGQVYSKTYDASDHCMEEDEWLEAQQTHSGYAVLFPIN
jgi:hypothetical protein